MSAALLSAGLSLLGGIMNKQGYDAQAERERQAGIANIARIRREASSAEGTMMVAFGKSGVTMEGSPMDAIGQNAYNAAMDEYVSNFNTQSSVAASKQKGRSALVAGVAGAASAFSSASAGASTG